MQWTFTLDEINTVAAEILNHPALATPGVIALYGQMGAGKTTFTSALLRALGSHDVATSPTFSIINQYFDKAGKPVYHMDWYRLRDEEEALQAGVEDPMYSGNWCLVEWPEKAENLLPEHTIKIQLTANENGSRSMLLSP